MNILLLIADDLGLMAGCYGERSIRTPRIDGLAAQGTRFDMAFTSTASCSASRSVILTGLHTHQNGQYGLSHDHHHFQTFGHVASAPRLLAEAGHHTGIVGKVHVGPRHVYPWDVVEESGTRDVRWVTRRAGAYFDARAADGRPFFLTVGFIDPHRDLTRGGFGNDVRGSAEDPVFDPGDVAVPPFLSDLLEVRAELAAYYRAAHRLDRGVGYVLNALAAAGLAGETAVLFLSDNGAPFLNSKTTLHDAGIHLPLLMRVPGRSAGVANPNLVSFTDLLPTFLDLAGASPDPGPRRGRSLLPILEARTRLEGWDRVFGSHTFHEVTNYWPTRFLRTPRWKYHRNVAWQLDFPFSADLYGSLSREGMRRQDPPRIGERAVRDYVRRPPEELFDLQADPGEVRNRAGDPDQADRLAAFRAEMEEWQRETGDPWLYRDGVSVRAVRHHMDEGLSLPGGFDFDPSAPA
jgi:N-sulfoglucosamine sulfohydrolase